MAEFALEKIEILHSRLNIFKLLINGKCLFDEFWKDVERFGGYEKELDTIQAIIERKAQLQPVSPEKYKELKGRKKNDPHKDYEIRTPNLRVYLFKQEKTGHIIVLGAIKTPKGQDQDIDRMRGIKKRYFENL
jgi:hypothetical protein